MLAKLLQHFGNRFRSIEGGHSSGEGCQVCLHLQQGAWLIMLNLTDVFWHVPVHMRLHQFLAFQAWAQVFQFTVTLFGISVVPRVFTKLMKTVANVFVEPEHQWCLRPRWLVSNISHLGTGKIIDKRARELAEAMDFSFNLLMSSLVPFQHLVLWGMLCDMVSMMVLLSADNYFPICWERFRVLMTLSMSHKQWESLLGSLNNVAEVVPQERLCNRHLCMVVFPSKPRDLHSHVPTLAEIASSLVSSRIPGVITSLVSSSSYSVYLLSCNRFQIGVPVLHGTPKRGCLEEL